MTTDREIGIEEARAKLGDLVRDATDYGIATAITRHGKRAAMLVPDHGTAWKTGRAFLARATHDLNDVTEVRIVGWAGRYVIAPHGSGPNRNVEIQAPERHDGEFWTFSRPVGGVLTCFTDLLGSPSLLGPTEYVMTVLLPAGRMDDIKVTFTDPSAPETTTEQQ